MKILNVINVGQGDSMLICPPDYCRFSNKDIYVDLGPGGVNVAQYRRPEHDVSIFITHHDADHLKGISHFLNNLDNISELILPFYQNEIYLIARAILNLKGINYAVNCSHFITLLSDIVYNQNFLSHISWNGAVHLRFAYEGMRYCEHIEVLNPPIVPQCTDWLDALDVAELEEIFYDLFNEEFAHYLSAYVDYSRRGYQSDERIFRDIIRFDYEDLRDNNLRVALQKKVNVVLDFIIRNLDFLHYFNVEPNHENMDKVYESYINCTHDSCIVLKMYYEGKTFLLTADASKKVFNRLMSQNRFILRSDYLKVPHHGSKNNMNAKILNAIDPEVAIISHDNGRFGRATDPHPNKEVIKLLRKKGVDIMVTNDVKKKKRTVIAKRNNRVDRYVDII